MTGLVKPHSRQVFSMAMDISALAIHLGQRSQRMQGWLPRVLIGIGVGLR